MGNVPPQGADLVADGVRYRIWAPEHARIAVHVFDAAGSRLRTVPLVRHDDGFHEGTDAAGAAGDLYKYEIDGRGVFADPLSRFQPQGVHGPSMVVDPSGYSWNDGDFKRPGFRELAIYEVHVGTFTAEGTFAAAVEKLAYLRELGVNAIELMPVADFPGERNWGYDGVSLYAPAHAYGTPDDFRAFVDAAHRAGLLVILDAVYNHFGPDGNYLREFSAHYFNGERKTPWGDSLNFDRPDGKPVRAFFLENALYWMRDFHIDGFRLDATHALYDDSPVHLLAEIAEAVQARGGCVIAEDERNEARIVIERECGGYGCNAVWADDFHHNVQVALTRDVVYREDYKGDVDELVDTLRHGWLYRGQFNRHFKKPWGTECGDVSLEKFVFCISNHDQVGNRAFGERLSHIVSPAQYRAASALLCLTAYTPLIFMGQEWAASAPFLYFTNHHSDLGKLVTEGRRK
ncbi:MAG: malto-oligosyltrehalose trehalohydrolase, partial [Verrucomicrobiota bacterium]|nr:malto-oligosyltrehalose trehalohydrolase [Verrucomicrobiota bacterium]